MLDFKELYTRKYKMGAYDMLKKLVSFSSVLDEYVENGKEPFGTQNRLILQYVVAHGDYYGFDTLNVDNYAGHIEFGKGDEILGILAHLDVVPVNPLNWNSDPFTLIERDGKLIARGVVDDKGPFVAAYIAMRMLKENGFEPKKRVRLIFGCDEESGSRCIERYFSKEPKPDLAFSPDADFPLIYGEKAHYTYDILVNDNVIKSFKSGTRYNVVPDQAEAILNVNLSKEFNKYLKDNGYDGSYDEEANRYRIKGRASHAMNPEKGVNAAYLLFNFIHQNTNSSLAEFVFNYYLYDTRGIKASYNSYDENMKELTSNFAIVDIDDFNGKIGINCRCPKNSDFDVIKNNVTKFALGYGYTFKEISRKNLHYVNPDSDFIKVLMSVYQEVTGDYMSKPFTIGGGTYASEIENGVAFGPKFIEREDVCHIANEYLYKEDLDKLIEIYFKAIYELTK